MVVVHFSFLCYKQIHIHIATIIIVLSVHFMKSISLINQSRYIKTIDLSMRLWEIITEFLGFIPQSLMLRSIVSGWILRLMKNKTRKKCNLKKIKLISLWISVLDYTSNMNYSYPGKRPLGWCQNWWFSIEWNVTMHL